MTQITIVYLIGILLIVFLAYRVLRALLRKDEGNGYCSSCPSSPYCTHNKTIEKGKCAAGEDLLCDEQAK